MLVHLLVVELVHPLVIHWSIPTWSCQLHWWELVSVCHLWPKRGISIGFCFEVVEKALCALPDSIPSSPGSPGLSSPSSDQTLLSSGSTHLHVTAARENHPITTAEAAVGKPWDINRNFSGLGRSQVLSPPLLLICFVFSHYLQQKWRWKNGLWHPRANASESDITTVRPSEQNCWLATLLPAQQHGAESSDPWEFVQQIDKTTSSWKRTIFPSFFLTIFLWRNRDKASIRTPLFWLNYKHSQRLTYC